MEMSELAQRMKKDFEKSQFNVSTETHKACSNRVDAKKQKITNTLPMDG